MSEWVQCCYLNRRAPALLTPPKPGALGRLLKEHVSQEAWQLWLKEQTRLINEGRLDPLSEAHRKTIHAHMYSFLNLPSDERVGAE